MKYLLIIFIAILIACRPVITLPPPPESTDLLYYAGFFWNPENAELFGGDEWVGELSETTVIVFHKEGIGSDNEEFLLSIFSDTTLVNINSMETFGNTANMWIIGNELGTTDDHFQFDVVEIAGSRGVWAHNTRIWRFKVFQ